jgi:hypothetical protein
MTAPAEEQVVAHSRIDAIGELAAPARACTAEDGAIDGRGATNSKNASSDPPRDGGSKIDSISLALQNAACQVCAG